MRISVDTNAYSDFMRGHANVREWIGKADEIHLTAVVLGELRAGFVAGSRSQKNETGLSRFLQSPRVGTLAVDEATSHHYARVFAFLRGIGRPVPTNDLWIAALSLQHDLVLLSRDAHFDGIPGLVRVW